jgi:outer membrane protein TolC
VTAKTPVCILLCAALLFPAAVVSPARAAESDLEEVYLSLDDCLRMALENNLALVSARYGPDLAEQGVATQQSEFDPGLQADYTYSEGKSAATQVSTVTGQIRNNFNLGVQQNLKFGGDYTAGFGTTRSEQTGQNVLAPISYFSGFNFVFNLPIMKGFGSTVTTEQLVLARNDYEISKQDLEVQAQRTMQELITAYWNVVAARAALDVAIQSLQRAQDLLDLNRKKVEVGTLAPIEITQAEAGVADNEEDVIIAQATLEDAEDELRRLMAIPAADPMWNQEIKNATRPVVEEQTIDLDQTIETALENRPEMISAEQRFRNTELSEKVAKKSVKHELDFQGVWGPTGASLDEANFITGEVQVEADWQESMKNIGNGDVYNWSAGLVYRVPIGNRAAKANFAQARILRERSQVDLDDQSQTIRVEVRKAVRAVESGIKRIEAARANVVLQTKKLDAEQKKFDNGMSTSFQVLEFQNDLATAELSRIQAHLDYINALAELERAKGTLLESYGLSLQMSGHSRPAGSSR